MPKVIVDERDNIEQDVRTERKSRELPIIFQPLRLYTRDRAQWFRAPALLPSLLRVLLREVTSNSVTFSSSYKIEFNSQGFRYHYFLLIHIVHLQTMVGGGIVPNPYSVW